MTKKRPRTPGLQVVQINLHHCEAASEDLMLSMEQEGIDIALIQEPWLVRDKIRGLKAKGYDLFFLQKTGKKRACIVARSSLKLILLS